VAAAPARAGSGPRTAPATTAGGAQCTGLVALTFDDGPAPGVTERLVRVLRRLGVRATFFMVGRRVAAAPATARAVADAGFAVGNHTWAHTDLATQSAAAQRRALLETGRALHRAGVPPTRLMRPPYGSLDAGARQVIRSLGLVPVLWTIDSRDWQSGDPGQIAHRILSALRPGPDNVVLQHDGVERSPVSVRAVPTVVRVARRRGYCFVGLDRSGRPSWPHGYHPHAG
jgi:peptidoglycan/xylan/chitin deacetylase (PgdA/CDA1 family)